MAILTKTRARSPLASAQLNYGWSCSEHGESFRLSIMTTETEKGESRFYRMEITSEEAMSFALYVAQRAVRETRSEFSGLYKTKTDAQALRDLADKIEGK